MQQSRMTQIHDTWRQPEEQKSTKRVNQSNKVEWYKYDVIIWKNKNQLNE